MPISTSYITLKVRRQIKIDTLTSRLSCDSTEKEVARRAAAKVFLDSCKRSIPSHSEHMCGDARRFGKILDQMKAHSPSQLSGLLLVCDAYIFQSLISCKFPWSVVHVGDKQNSLYSKGDAWPGSLLIAGACIILELNTARLYFVADAGLVVPDHSTLCSNIVQAGRVG